jgi:RimJ/RimL family protein N-acetyltransferase
VSFVAGDEPTGIRALARSDSHAIQFMFHRLGETSRYQRFLSGKRDLSPRELARLVNIDHWHHEAVLAWSGVPRTPIGVARYVRAESFDVAELAVVVDDRWQRSGIGARLLDELAARARRAGVRRFTATALAGNRGALAVARRLDPDLSIARDGYLIELSGRLPDR